LLKIFCFAKKVGIAKITKKSAWTPLPPLSLKCDTPIVQNNQNRTHQKKKKKGKLKYEPPYMS
jgi:hypothetical protein